MDSCVGITVYSKQNSYSNFYGYGSNSSSDSSDNQQASGEGSGVIMKEANGKTYIMTCAHVISDGSSFKVTLNNGKEYTATMVGADSQTDIGVLSIEATGLQAATFADSKSLTVGEQVVAIGCPGGLEFKTASPAAIFPLWIARWKAPSATTTNVSKRTQPSIRATPAARCLTCRVR